jgi:epoxyqueuosine reductase
MTAGPHRTTELRRNPHPAFLIASFWRKITSMEQALETTWLVDRARAVGFDLCGAVRPEKFPELLHGEEWLSRGYAGEMDYLADTRRLDPRSAMTGVRSVIVCALNYNTKHRHSTDAALTDASNDARGWISRYAWGRDYHHGLREKLDALLAELRAQFPEPFDARVYADTGPVQERVLAKYAGLGWLGKNTLLINEEIGSFFFLGVILTTLDLQPAGYAPAPPPDRCGSCRRCIDACPTQAFVQPYVMDARRCISYLTIELRGSIPEELRAPMGPHVFGCDICQDVCPWNRRAPITAAAEFQPRTFSASQHQLPHQQDLPDAPPAEAVREAEPSGEDSLLLPRLAWLAAMTEAEFREVFRGSPIKRTKWRGLVRNACVAAGNSSVPRGTSAHSQLQAVLGRLATSPEAIIAESAQWALERIQRSA